MKHIKGQINRNARLKIPTNINEMKVYENNITRLNSFSRKASLFPNLGEGFLIQNRYDPRVYMKILYSRYKNPYNGEFFGIKVDKEGQVPESGENFSNNHFDTPNL